MRERNKVTITCSWHLNWQHLHAMVTKTRARWSQLQARQSGTTELRAAEGIASHAQVLPTKVCLNPVRVAVSQSRLWIFALPQGAKQHLTSLNKLSLQSLISMLEKLTLTTPSNSTSLNMSSLAVQVLLSLIMWLLSIYFMYLVFSLVLLHIQGLKLAEESIAVLQSAGDAWSWHT